MKKWWLVCLVCICVGCSAKTASIQETPLYDDKQALKVMVASDMHYLTQDLYNKDNKAFDWLVHHSDGKMFQYSEEIMNAFIAQVLEEKPDVLILSGDLTFNGELASHKDLAKKLEIVSRQGISVYVLPGNHDFSQYQAYDYSQLDQFTKTTNTTRSEFLDIYSKFGYDNVASRDKTSMSTRVMLNDLYQLLFIDVNGNQKENVISDETMAWIEDQLQIAQEMGAEVIVVSHQNTLVHNERFFDGFTISNYRDLLGLFDTYEVRLGLSGHLHIQHIASVGNYTDIASGSLALLKHQYGILWLNEDGSIDYHTEALKVDLPEDSMAFFGQISRLKVSDTLEFSSLSDEDKALMYDFVVTVNEHYFLGDLYQVQEDLLASEGYALWYDFEDGGRFGAYLLGIITEPSHDNNSLTLKGRN